MKDFKEIINYSNDEVSTNIVSFLNFNKNSNVVGIHYDRKTSKGIYGKTTPEEASELIEEGIEVVSIPWVDKSEN